MKKLFDRRILKIALPFFAALILFAVPNSANAAWWEAFTNTGDFLAEGVGWLAIQVLLRLTTLLTLLGGAVLNFVVDYTVVNMADHVTGSSGVINKAWGTIRDIANMGFIFILLYASIQMILGVGRDVQRTIVNVIIIAILINFSLFLTKVVIDVSNVLAVTFYGAMAPGALDEGLNGGIANSLMEPLKVSTIMSATESVDLGGTTLIIVGVMGSVVALIAAFVFFAVAIMFIIRFVVLVFVMVLSPIAFMSYILPDLKKHGDRWKDALLGQAFFAPIYFMLTWIVIVIANGLFTESGNIGEAFTGVLVEENGQMVAKPSEAGIAAFMNFFIIIAMLIASLIIAKDWANKAGDGVKNLTKWATGMAGTASFGLAGYVGRQTLGRRAEANLNNKNLLDRSIQEGMSGRLARLQLAASRKVSGASFDMRATGLNKQLDAGKAGGKGGFAKYKEDKAKEAEKRAKELAPKPEVIDQAKQDLERHTVGDEKTTNKIDAERMKEERRHQKRLRKLQKRRARREAAGASEYELREIDDMIAESQTILDSTLNIDRYAQARVERLEGVKKKGEVDNRKKRDIEDDPDVRNLSNLKTQLENKQEELKNAKLQETQDLLKKEIENINQQIKTAETDAEKAKKRIENEYKERERRGEFAGAGERRKRGYAKVVERSFWAKAKGYNTAGAAKIRSSKSTNEQLAELAKKAAKESEEAEGGGEKGGEAEPGGEKGEKKEGE